MTREARVSVPTHGFDLTSQSNVRCVGSVNRDNVVIAGLLRFRSVLSALSDCSASARQQLRLQQSSHGTSIKQNENKTAGGENPLALLTCLSLSV